MIGFHTKMADDVNTSIVNGLYDDDLEALAGSIDRRMKIASGVRECPECGELMEGSETSPPFHDHDGMRYMVIGERAR